MDCREELKILFQELVPNLISATELAKKIGMSSSLIYGWRAGKEKIKPSIKNAENAVMIIKKMIESGNMKQKAIVTTDSEGTVISAKIEFSSEQQTLFRLVQMETLLQKELADAQNQIETLTEKSKELQHKLSDVKDIISGIKRIFPA